MLRITNMAQLPHRQTPGGSKHTQISLSSNFEGHTRAQFWGTIWVDMEKIGLASNRTKSEWTATETDETAICISIRVQINNLGCESLRMGIRRVGFFVNKNSIYEVIKNVKNDVKKFGVKIGKNHIFALSLAFFYQKIDFFKNF